MTSENKPVDTNEVSQPLTVPLEQYNKAVTLLIYLFNLSIDLSNMGRIDIDSATMTLDTTLGKMPETSIRNIFANTDKLVYEATLSEGFSLVAPETLVETKPVEPPQPKLTLLN